MCISIRGPPKSMKCYSAKKTHVLKQRNMMLMQSACMTVYVMKTDDANKTLAGHVPIELSQLLSYFLQANAENQLAAQVTGKRKREVGLVVPAKFTAFTPKLRKARILERELNGRAAKYSHFELKNITISENKLPKLF